MISFCMIYLFLVHKNALPHIKSREKEFKNLGCPECTTNYNALWVPRWIQNTRQVRFCSQVGTEIPAVVRRAQRGT